MKRHRVRESHKGRNAILLILVLIIVVSVAIVAYQWPINKTDTDAPLYSTFSASSTKFSSSCTFSVLWNDDVNVSGYVFGTNNTGTFVNDTWATFSSYRNETSAYSSVTKTLNDTIGNVVQWAVWCNDSVNHWQTTGMQNVFVDSNKVLLVTTMGNITIRLYDDMPITTANFRNLVRRGIYDNTIFHRVIDGFMIQGGDPTGTGYGDPSIPAIPDEFSSDPNHNRNDRSTVAMANAGPNTGSSQFFINLVNNNYLDGKHPVFGKVIAGMDVIDAIGKVPTGSNNKPLTNVTIVKAMFIY